MSDQKTQTTLNLEKVSDFLDDILSPIMNKGLEIAEGRKQAKAASHRLYEYLEMVNQCQNLKQ
jgi:hypothetical protein